MEQIKHNENLDMLCRICSAVLTDYSYNTKAYDENIEKVFNINVRNDNEEVHPPFFCLKCYATVQNCLKNGSKPSFQSTVWSAHKIDNCTTCILRQQKAKGGRPKKT